MTKSEILPTYAEIAAKAGVSTKTVCNVFINPGIVRKKTMDKVLKVLPHFGVTDPSAMKVKRRLAGPSNQKTLLFLEDVQIGLMNSPVFAMIVRAAETHAHTLGWQLLVRHKRENASLEESIRDFRGHGVILFGNNTSQEELARIFPEMPTVRLLAPPAGGPDCDNIDYDRQEVAKIAAEYLKNEGCRKVAYFGEAPNTELKKTDRRGLFMAEVAKLEMDFVDGGIKDFFLHKESMQTVNMAILEAAWSRIESTRPDGIFVQSDQVANALYQFLASKGIKPMKDLRIISCNAEQLWLAPLQPRPATIDIRSAELGRRAVETILWRIKNKKAPHTKVVLQPNVVPGASFDGSENPQD